MNQFLRITGIGVLLIGLGLTAQPADAAAYLKIGDIQGESQDRDHKGWSDIESFSQGSELEGEDVFRRRGCPLVSPLEISKQLDSASVPIQFAMLRGQAFDTVELEVTREGGDSGPLVYLKYELLNVVVSDYSISGDSEDVPEDSFSLNFERVRVEYIPTDPKSGGPGKAIVDSYDVSACK